MATLCLHWDTPDGGLDHRSVMDTTARFCERAVGPLGERPESPPTLRQMADVITAADEAGLLPHPDLPGLGLWAEFSPESLLLSAEILARTAEHSAAAAYHLHQTALGRRLTARLAISETSALPCLYSEAGLAKGAAGSYLGGGPDSGIGAAAALPGLKPAETTLPLLWYAAEPWRAIVLPVWQPERGGLAWGLADREAVSLTASPHSHGLEGMPLWRLRFERPPEVLSGTDALGLYREMLALDAIGLVAIGLGSARAALAAANRYARQRRQGGKLIYEHAAVRLLLGGADADTTVVEALLKQLTASPRDLRNVFLLRSTAHPLLCRAATSALQVFGGYGYMRDFGLERALRDNNVLRLCAGSPNDLILTALAMEQPA